MHKICKFCNQEKDLTNFLLRKDSGKYRNECKKCASEKLKDWKRENEFDKYQYIKHREKKLSAAKNYREDPRNKNKIKAGKRRYLDKVLADPEKRMIRNMRRRCLLALKGRYKYATTFKLVGCSHEELIKYLESLWREGMSWDNYGSNEDKTHCGRWHIDHIKPISSFDLSKEDQQKACFHFSNLQPLWAEENLAKGCSVSR
jgi:hypothetical protein